MNFDDLFIAIIIAGIGLSGASLCAKYCEWRKYQDAEKRKAARFKELYAHHMCLQEREACASSGGGQQKLVNTIPRRRFQGSVLERTLIHSRTSFTGGETPDDTF